MPKDPAGNFSLIPSYYAEPGTVIRVESHNPVLEDIAGAISSSLDRAGRNGMVGPLDLGSFPIRNVDPGTVSTDAATVGQVPPIGAVIDFAGSAAPTGWLLCYGQAVSRTTYAALFAVIGTAFGTGNGTTTFNVPDLRGRVVAGKDNMGGAAANRLTAGNGSVAGVTLGASGGAQEVAISIAQMPLHNHGGSTGQAGTHFHTYLRSTGRTPGGDGSGGDAPVYTNTNTSTAPNHAHPITAQGGGDAHNNVQPTFILNKIIKAAN
jgi:microcystin-dependent protein